MPAPEIEKITAQLQELLTPLLKLAGLHLKFQIRPGAEIAAGPESPDVAPDVTVDFTGEDTDLLLQHGGELLEALEEIALRALRLPVEERGRIVFDSHDYKMLRVEELRLVAGAAAEKALQSGAPFALNPMNSRDRRIIHLALKDRPDVRTESRGSGSFRNVIVFPAEK